MNRKVTKNGRASASHVSIDDVMAIESMTFLRLAHAVDTDVAAHAPDIHNDYLAAARDQTRSHASLDEVDR